MSSASSDDEHLNHSPLSVQIKDNSPIAYPESIVRRRAFHPRHIHVPGLRVLGKRFELLRDAFTIISCQLPQATPDELSQQHLTT